MNYLYPNNLLPIILHQSISSYLSDQGIDIEISKSTTPHDFYSIYRLLLKNCRNLKMANKGRNM